METPDSPSSPTPPPEQPPVQVPAEILKSEYERSLPPRPERPGMFGLPPIPNDIMDVAVKYLPWLVLAAAVTNAAGALGALVGFTRINPDFSISPLTVVGATLSLAASAAGILAYFWLSDKTRKGWYLLVAAVGLQFLSGLILSGVGTLLGSMVGLLITAYILMELKGEYVD